MNLRWIGFVFFCLLVGCIENPTSGGKDTNLSGAVGGLGQLNPAEGAFLYDPTSTPNTDPTPTFLVTGLKNRDMVYLYHDSACGQLAASGDSTGDSLTMTVPALNPGIHSFSIKRRWEDDNIESPCSQNIISYELWNNNVILTGLADDSVPATTKSWSWGCSGEETTCEYRYAVTNSPTHVFNNSPYQLTDSAQQVSGTGTYYLHVQGRDALHSFLETPVETYSAVLDNTPPTVSTVQAPADATYNLSDNLDFRVTFSEAIAASGTPRLQLQVGAVTRYANYHSSNGGGTELTFRYSPQSGDSELGGISFVSTQIDLNGGSLQDTAGNQSTLDFSGVAPSLININVDAASPQVAGLANDPTPAKSKTWTWSCNRPNCSYRYTVDNISTTAPGGNYNPTPTSDALSSGNGTYYLHIQVRDNVSGQVSPVQHFSAILDNTVPVINSVLPPSNSTYSEAQAVDFILNYSDAVTVVGYPYISLNVSTDSRSAQYASGTGSSAITFRYLPQAGDSDLDGITVSGDSIQLNAGTIKDAAGNDASGDFTGLIPSLASVLVDGLPPNITAVSKPDDDTYDSSENIEFTLTFSETVSVSGAPRLSLTVGNLPRYANHYSNSGNQVTFRYTPQTGDRDDNGIQFQSPSIQFNGGQITDPAGNLANPDFSSSLPTLSGVRVDAQTLTITALSPPSSNTYGTFQGLHFSLTYSERVVVTGTPRLALQVGGLTRYAEYQNTSLNSILFTYTPQSDDFDDNGIAFSSPWINLNGGTIDDTGGNPVTLDFSAVIPDLTGVNIDAVLPIPADVTHDAIAKQNKTWNWSCSKDNCTYRFLVDTNPSTAPIGAYANITSTTQASGDGTHYLHIQARDSLGNESSVMHFSALLDNTAPTLSGIVEVSEFGASATQTVTTEWTDMTLSDAHSSVAKIQIAVGRDITEDGIDPEDIGRIAGWRDIPSGTTLSPARYQIQDGVDGFSLSLAEELNYFISLRIVDVAGNRSVELSSEEWLIFNPRRVPGLELWLDGQDLSTLFQDEACSNSVASDGQTVGCWRDKSEGAHHALQSSSGRRPTYWTGGHLRFNDNHDLNAGNILAGNYDDLSVFIVFRQLGRPNNLPAAFNLNAHPSSFNSCVDGDNARILAAMFSSGGHLAWEFGGCSTSTRRFYVNVNSVQGTRHFYEMGNNAAESFLFVRKNGDELGRRNINLSVSPSSSGQVLIGNGAPLNASNGIDGEISEFVLYTSPIDSDDRETLEGYLACKWNLQAELSSDHPYFATCP